MQCGTILSILDILHELNGNVGEVVDDLDRHTARVVGSETGDDGRLRLLDVHTHNLQLEDQGGRRRRGDREERKRGGGEEEERGKRRRKKRRGREKEGKEGRRGGGREVC